MPSETGHMGMGDGRDSEKDGDPSERPYFQKTGKAFVCSSAMMYNHLAIRLNRY